MLLKVCLKHSHVRTLIAETMRRFEAPGVIDAPDARYAARVDAQARIGGEHAAAGPRRSGGTLTEPSSCHMEAQRACASPWRFRNAVSTWLKSRTNSSSWSMDALCSDERRDKFMPVSAKHSR